jgi:DNA repair exonuclease SbcCD ATPase subunit
LLFRRLEVSHFRAVDRAALDFSPGLNVLYGPNDLGKTTLALALRAALLLPADSSAQREFLPWHSKEPPRVVLCLESQGTLWRISKTFGVGSGAQAQLESSLDCQRFREEARGRAADGRLRELLRWGVEAPGGRSGARGLPESFLSHVLLATQGSVAQILERTLSGDREGSGRAQLHEALQALAQDPLFQRVLGAVDARVESAFTATGRRKTGQSSPFAPLRQTIAELGQELERVSHLRRESDDVQQRIVQLNQDRLETEARVEALRERVARQEAALRELSAQRAVRERAAAAEQALEARRSAERDLRRLAVELQLGREASERQAQQVADSASARADAEVVAARAEAALRELSSAASRDARAERLAALEAERGQLELRVRRLERARDLARAAARAEAAHETETRSLRQAQAAAAELGQRLAAQEQLLVRARQLESVARWREASERAEQARQAERLGRELQARASVARERAAALAAQAGSGELLSPERARELRDLDRQLRVARARIEVGLSVTLALPPDRAAAISVDGGPARRQGAEQRPVVARARSEVRVQLDDDVQLWATAGDPELRAEAQALTAAWAERVEPLLSAAGVSDIDGLAQRAEQAQQRRREADALRREAAELEARGAEKLELGSELERWQARAEALRAALGEADPESLARELGALGASWEVTLGRRIAEAEREQRRQQGVQATQAGALERLAASVAGAERERELAGAALAAALAELGLAAQGVQSSQLERELALLERALGAASRAHAEEQSAFRRQLGAAERARDAALSALEASRQAEQAALGLSREAREQELRLGAQLRERELHFDPSLLPAAEAASARARAELAALPELPAVSAEMLESSRGELELASSRLAQLLAELRRAEGALGQVGGDVVSQRESQTREALERARDAERELEREYDAYQLLAQTLRSVENEQGAHLGRALSEPVSERFARLTRGRYGRIELDAALGFEGIQIAGQARAYRELSEGTQEQLATIFRLCVAEQLDTALVLDDHLVQTHHERVAWFRSALREAAERIQILVLTARPEDYLEEGELDAPFAPASRTRVIDLEGVIQRASYAR